MRRRRRLCSKGGRGDLVSSRSRLEMKGLKRSIKAGQRSRERKRRR